MLSSHNHAHDSGQVSCSDEVQWRVRLSLGVETGWIPGAALTGAAPVLTFLAFLLAYRGD